jgi:hypothetical protein
MDIQIDSREKAKAITKIIDTFDRQGHKYFVSKLPVGDYQSLDNARKVIDRKQNLGELCGNICQQHDRFKAEMIRANELGIKLIILCEHGGKIHTLEDVKEWKNPRKRFSSYAMNGETLYKTLCTISKRYDVDFHFCHKTQTGQRILELLQQ